MEHFCGHNLWDNQLTWNTTSPLFTPCFGQTLLTWIPSGFLWIVAPFALHKLIRSPNRNVPWTILNICKTILALLLSVTSAVQLIAAILEIIDGFPVHPVEYYSPFITFLTYCLAAFLILLQRRKGVHSSGILFIFWFLLSIGATIYYWTIIATVIDPNGKYWTIDKITFICHSIQTPAILCSFLLSCFADTRREYFTAGEDYKNECPLLRASFLNQIGFFWYDTMAYLGWKKSLTQDDMWDLTLENKTEAIYEKFRRYLEDAIMYTFNSKQKYQRGIVNTVEDHSILSVNVVAPLFKAFWPQLLGCAIIKLVSSFLTFANPLLLDQLIAFVASDAPIWHGYVLALGMASAALLDSLLTGQYEFWISVTSMRMRSALIASIYRKSLKLSSSGRRDFTAGEIVNLMAVDTQRVVDYINIYNLLWAAPIQIFLALYLLWNQLGVASLAGIAVMIILVPLNGFITMRLKTLQGQLMGQKDRRTKLMSEILNGIKVLKLYAWEGAFGDLITNIRSFEIKALREQAKLSAGIVFAFSCAPFFVAFASFCTFVLIDANNVLDANKAFVSLSLFNILRIPLALLPMVVSYGANFIISIKRINKYLQGDEIDPETILHEHNSKSPVSIRNGTFSWSKEDEPVLKEMTLDIKDKSLVAIVGQVGSGKSSLLSALLGDLYKTEGYVNVYGKIAYVPQSAWIQNATVRQNITFSQPYIQDKYDKVIEACALSQDLKILTGGDLTEIGEKGINLSGGQKQRVSLARAVYANSDIYFLDDPLSAVDAHVSRHLFDKVIGPTGMLKKKTRILVTHRVTFLPQVDEIIVLKDGKITEQGTYHELLAKNGEFAQFLIQFVTENHDEEMSAADKEILEQLKEKIGPELEKRGSLVKSDLHSESSDGIRKRTISNSSRPSLRKSTTSRSASQLREEPGQSKSNADKFKLVESEVAQTGKVKWSVYVDFLKACGLISCLFLMLAFCASSVFNLLSSLWLTEWSNDSLKPSAYNDTALRNTRLGVYFGLGIAETTFTLTNSIILNFGILRGAKIIHEGMLYRMIRAPMSFYDTTPLGRILNRFTKDIDVIDVSLTFNVRMLISQSFRAVVAIIAICIQTPYFLIAVLPIGLIYTLVQKFYISSSRQLKRIESITRSPVYSHFSETVSGATSIRAYSCSERFINECYSRVDTNHTSYFPNLSSNRWLGIRLEFLGNLIVFFAAIFAVLTRGTLEPGYTGLSISYAMTITGVLNMLVRAVSDVETNIVSVERCLEYTRTPMEAPWEIPNKRTQSKWPDKGQIVFKNYSTRYRPGLDLVLKEISCTIKPNEKVGIVGRTGAGKSSLTLALFRIIEPAGGRIDIDDQDISQLGLHNLRSRLTVIPQDPVLFSGSFRRNFDPFERHTDTEIWKALELSHLKSFVDTLDSGLNYEISEGGENLSVGQKQLVCLTRALLRKTKVLVLDEATAAVDIETDELIQQTIRKEFADCTIVTIAHRLNTIMDYNRIIVMDKGKIIEFDSPENLLKDSKSAFYSMAKEANLVASTNS